MDDYNRGALKEPCLRLPYGSGYESVELGDGTGFVKFSEYMRLVQEVIRLDYDNGELLNDVSDMNFFVNDNRQLREFVVQLIRFICPEEHQYSCNRECPAYKKCQGSPKCEFVDWAIERAAELEIEMDG